MVTTRRPLDATGRQPPDQRAMFARRGLARASGPDWPVARDRSAPQRAAGMALLHLFVPDSNAYPAF